MIETYLKSPVHGYAPKTLEMDRWWLEHLQAFAGGAELTRLSPDELTRWSQDLIWRPGPQGRNYTQATVGTAIGAVRRFFGWALAQGRVARDPSTHLKRRREAAVPKRRLTPGETRRLLEAVDPTAVFGSRDRAMLGVVLETGVSRVSCSGIDVAHLQLDTGALLTSRRRQAGGQVHSLSTGLLMDLRGYLDFSRPGLARAGEPALFVGRDGTRLSPDGVRQTIAAQAQRAGVPRPPSFS